MHILFIEDNPKIATATRLSLEAHGYRVAVAETGAAGEEAAVREGFELILLDLMLPDRDGVEVCKRLRGLGVATPILMLTALSATQDKITGLDAGADDYLTKPFDFQELLARVRALLRRGRASESAILKYDDLELDLVRRTARRGEQKFELSSREFALLEFLMRNADRVMDRVTIAQKVWGLKFEPSSNVIDVYISSLRKKLDRGFDDHLLHTVIGAGYRLGCRGDQADPPAGS